MKILVTLAVQAEFAPWQRRRNFMRVAGDWPVFETMFGSIRVRAVLTGMGRDHALRAAQKFLAEKPEICVSSGLAGALRGGYPTGDIGAARFVRGDGGEGVWAA